MRLLQFFALLLIAPCLFGVSSFAQDAKPAQRAQPMVQAPARTPPQASAATDPAAPSSSEAKPVPGQGLPTTKIKVVILPPKPQKTPKSPDDRLLMKDALQVPLESLQKAIQEARERELLQPYHLSSGKGLLGDGELGSFDNGIYLRQTEGANVFCGAIVSYNFSSGQNPRLESVTTCTPGNVVASKRARGPNKMPQGPRVVLTKYRAQDKK